MSKSFAHFSVALSFYCWAVRVLSVFRIQVFYQIWLGNIFSHVENFSHSLENENEMFSFHFLDGALWSTITLFWWIQLIYFVVVVFVVYIFGVMSKKALPNQRSLRFTPVFLEFYSFSSYLGLWSIMSNFCIWCEVGSTFILLCVDIQLSQHHLMKRRFFSPTELSWQLCQKSVDHKYKSLFLDFQFCSNDLCVYPSASTTLSCWL